MGWFSLSENDLIAFSGGSPDQDPGASMSQQPDHLDKRVNFIATVAAIAFLLPLSIPFLPFLFGWWVAGRWPYWNTWLVGLTIYVAVAALIALRTIVGVFLGHPWTAAPLRSVLGDPLLGSLVAAGLLLAWVGLIYFQIRRHRTMKRRSPKDKAAAA